jgi:hypothetical protein
MLPMLSSDLRALVQAFATRLEQEVRADIRVSAAAMLDGRASQSAKRGRRAPTKSALARGRRLQGKYLGHLRALRGRDRQRVKKVARRDGVAAAIALAQRLRG